MDKRFQHTEKQSTQQTADDSLQIRKTRKAHHLDLAVQYHDIAHEDVWRDIRFVHCSLPELDAHEIDLVTQVGGRKWKTPIYINAMTGGIEEAATVNRTLAEVARHYGLGIAVGSQSAALADARVVDTYRVVREIMEDGIVFANVGALVPPEHTLRAVEMIAADYLQLHVNFPQEIVMPEGDRSFRGALANIREVAVHSPVPVIVKEVGFGMSREIYTQLADVGVKLVDVGGRGGTNFAWIENQRRKECRSIFEDWGQTTPISLLEAQSYLSSLEFLASGGIKTALDMAKAIALGAHAVGVAGTVLKLFYKGGKEAVMDQVETWLDGLRSVMLALGTASIEDLYTVPVVVLGTSYQWATTRGIDVQTLARR